MIEVQAAGGAENLPGTGNGEEDADVVPVHWILLVWWEAISSYNFCTTDAKSIALNI
ncbi:hypothetical protein D3C72_2479890 [compost metagenome]